MKNLKIIISVLLLAVFAGATVAQTPEMPVVDSVSVSLLTKRPIIAWHVTAPNDVDGYIVKRQIFGAAGVVDGTFNTIKAIDYRHTTTYEDNSSQYGYALPAIRPEAYRLASTREVDGSTEFSVMSEIHATIFVQVPDYEQCKEQNTLNWSKYVGWGEEISEYRIFVRNSETDNPTLLTSVGKDVTTFVHENLEPNRNYYYFVRAIHTDGVKSSSSNEVWSFSAMPEPPDMLNADYATTLSPQSIKLSFSFDNSDVLEYRVLRANSPTAAFDTIYKTSNFSSPIEYTDTDASLETDSKTYYYKLLAISLCGKEMKESNLAHNIVFTAAKSEAQNLHNNLSWTSYTTWLGDVERYNIYRSFDNVDYQLLTTVTAFTNNFIDDVSPFVRGEVDGQAVQGLFCYYVEAVETGDNPHSIRGESKSNKVCVTYPSNVELPNAFNPSSTVFDNRFFKPQLTFVSNYSLIIYSRWGNKVFETNKLSEGWNGRVNEGELATKGAYMYYLHYTSADGRFFEKNGTVMVVYK